MCALFSPEILQAWAMEGLETERERELELENFILQGL